MKRYHAKLNPVFFRSIVLIVFVLISQSNAKMCVGVFYQQSYALVGMYYNIFSI